MISAVAVNPGAARIDLMIRNHFLEDLEAADYDRARPYFHPLVFTRLAQLVPVHALGRVLDVACGTGQSTEAMGGVCSSVIGLDASAAMLRRARPLEATGTG